MLETIALWVIALLLWFIWRKLEDIACALTGLWLIARNREGRIQ